MPSIYHVTEPHPTVPRSSRLYSGRGGAGNIAYVPSSSDKTPVIAPRHETTKRFRTGIGGAGNIRPASERPSSTFHDTPQSTNRRFRSGIGGVGNVHQASERAIFSFDEELERLRRSEGDAAPVYHVGRGGSGNAFDRRDSLSSGSAGSLESVSVKGRGSEDRERQRSTGWIGKIFS